MKLLHVTIPGEIDTGFDTFALENSLYMHEYGHTFQSQRFGLSYMFVIGIPSGISVLLDKWDVNNHEHNTFGPERGANRLAARYFGDFGVTWNDLRFPR